MHSEKTKKGVSIKPFVIATLTIAIITFIYKIAPDWVPDVTINLAKEYIDERKGPIGYKLSMGIVIALSGYIGFLFTEKKKYKAQKISKTLNKTISALQTSGGVFFGWGVGLLVYTLFTHKYDQIAIGVVTLSYMLLLTFYPLLLVEEVITWKEQKKNSKKKTYILRALCLIIMILGAIMIGGILFAGW